MSIKIYILCLNDCPASKQIDMFLIIVSLYKDVLGLPYPKLYFAISYLDSCGYKHNSEKAFIFKIDVLYVHRLVLLGPGELHPSRNGIHGSN